MLANGPRNHFAPLFCSSLKSGGWLPRGLSALLEDMIATTWLLLLVLPALASRNPCEKLQVFFLLVEASFRQSNHRLSLCRLLSRAVAVPFDPRSDVSCGNLQSLKIETLCDYVKF